MRKKYDAYTDEELIRLYREGDEDAVEFLLLKHRSIVTAKASNYYLKGGERDDLLQIGMIGLMRAVWNFKEEKDIEIIIIEIIEIIIIINKINKKILKIKLKKII